MKPIRVMRVISAIWVMGIMLCPGKGYGQLSTAKDSLHTTGFNTARFQPVNTMPLFPSQKNNLPAPVSFSASFINPGFFCRQEVKMDKKLPVPLRIRLGSVQYCNWLEQKPGYTNMQQ